MVIVLWVFVGNCRYSVNFGTQHANQVNFCLALEKLLLDKRGKNNKLLHQVTRLGVWHEDDAFVPSGTTDVGQSYTSVTSSSLYDGSSWFYPDL